MFNATLKEHVRVALINIDSQVIDEGEEQETLLINDWVKETEKAARGREGEREKRKELGKEEEEGRGMEASVTGSDHYSLSSCFCDLWGK